MAKKENKFWVKKRTKNGLIFIIIDYCKLLNVKKNYVKKNYRYL